VLRAILGAQKARSGRISGDIMVVADPVTRRVVQRALFFTGRLPEAVQWICAPAGASLSKQLRLVTAKVHAGRIVLIDGSTTYHPSLIRKASEWKEKEEEAGLALISGGKPTGLYAFSVEAMGGAEPSLMPGETIQELQASGIAKYSIDWVEVSEDLWQRVSTEKERRSAERKLDRWLVKPTDGMYAQLNRRISIPISRQLIKFPVTANMGHHVHAWGRLCFGRILCSWRLLEHLARRTSMSVCEHFRRVRRRGRSLETSRVGFRLLAGNSM
jgi:hypothetical protein